MLDEPTAGDHYHFVVDVTPSATVEIDIKSAVSTFNSTGAKVVRFTTAGQYVKIEALSTVRWIVVDQSTGITFRLTT